ncbi:MAG: ABC transporter ATP-binding protein [Cyanophyceae cyanobacterium]
MTNVSAVSDPLPTLRGLPIVELRNVSKRYGSTVVLDDVNLKIFRGDALCIVGPSGTGKSTLLRLIAGLAEPDAGTIYWKGASLVDIQAGRHPKHLRVGMVFQQAALFDSLTVGENVGFSLYQHSRLSGKQIRALVTQKLAAVGLSGIEDRLPEQLSGGMRKRVSFARAIMEDPLDPADDPQILLYDEPTAGLDPIASTVIEDLIRGLKDQQGVCETYVVVTHQESTIRRAGERIILLAKGKVQWEGYVSEIDQEPDPYVRQFFSGSVEGPFQVVE